MNTIPAMSPAKEDCLPFAKVAADLDVPPATLRYWIKADDLPSDLRKQGRTRVRYLPPNTINALRARKQTAPLIVEEPSEEPTVPFLPKLIRPVPEIELPPLPALPTETKPVSVVSVRPVQKRGPEGIVPLLSAIGWHAVRMLLALHTSERTADWLVGPITYRSQKARPHRTKVAMNLRRR